MSYAQDTDDQEQCAQGEEHGRDGMPTDFQQMLQHFGYSLSYYSTMSNKDIDNMRWNWKHIAKRGLKT